MSELQTLKKQMAAVVARYKAAVAQATSLNVQALEAEEAVGVIKSERDDLRDLRKSFETSEGKAIAQKALSAFDTAIKAKIEAVRKLRIKTKQARTVADDAYESGERIYGRIQEYDDRYNFPSAFDEMY